MMINNRIPLVLLLISIGLVACQQAGPVCDFPKVDSAPIAKAQFDVLFELEQKDQNLFDLSITIELDSNNYIISPFSTDSIYGHFVISIPENKNLIPKGKLSEHPLSVEEFDPIITWPVRFVRETTTYTQSLQRLGSDDFTIQGLVEFLLEPTCVPYDVLFKISQRRGSMDVEKVETFVSGEYKR